MRQVKRGFVLTDKKEFYQEDNLNILKSAQKDIFYLLNRGYHLDRSVTFVGNAFLLSARQRTALIRATADKVSLVSRREKEVRSSLEGETIYIDTFNLIITLEIALCNSTLIRCMDGAIRDIAGLHGSYFIIDKTDAAICYTAQYLGGQNVSGAVFYLDSPVSNSGRLKQRILEIMCECGIRAEAYLVKNADRELEFKKCVASADAVVIDASKSWVNLSGRIIDCFMPDYEFIDLSGKDFI